MIKNICIIGSSGFIGSFIYKNLLKLKGIKVYRFSSRKKQFIDSKPPKYFDCLVFAAGIHNSENETNKIYRRLLTVNIFVFIFKR